MSKTMKWLIACMIFVVFAFGVCPAVYDEVWGQRLSSLQQLSKVSGQLSHKRRAFQQAERTLREFQQRATLSFGADLAKARVAYQEFLVQLTDACAVTSVMVTSSQPERLEALGSVLHFTLQATGTCEQFGKVIDGFYRTEALHRISHLSIYQSLGPDSPTHSLTMDVSLLVLERPVGTKELLKSPSNHELTDIFGARDMFRRQTAENPATTQTTTTSGMDMFRNLLSSLPATPSDESIEPPPEPEIATVPEELTPEPVEASDPLDPKANVRLVGIIQKDAVRYALFILLDEERQFALKESAELTEYGIDARITRILEGKIELLEKDQTLALLLGNLCCEATRP